MMRLIHFLVEHFKKLVKMVVLLSLVGGVMSNAAFFFWAKDLDDFLFALALFANAFITVVMTAIAYTIMEATAVAGVLGKNHD